MVRPDYRAFSMYDDGIMHFGVQGRSGRYPWGLVKDLINGWKRKRNGWKTGYLVELLKRISP